MRSPPWGVVVVHLDEARVDEEVGWGDDGLVHGNGVAVALLELGGDRGRSEVEVLEQAGVPDLDPGAPLVNLVDQLRAVDAVVAPAEIAVVWEALELAALLLHASQPL